MFFMISVISESFERLEIILSFMFQGDYTVNKHIEVRDFRMISHDLNTH